ncbi:Protein N-acetyltransferase, RimJ/RimL family [Maridesulfovibrio ferrireducens]|uniref:Protein N-acetyltransferase, RimJ/RimL family n=1 Tax=Maridesulfovibrio ferrireducens TaxID=246191 RepID=A0A1G9CQK5_9BACT|nr:GNAT family protein [Maridesulfovibrio ferrireducens]SDK53734.1 Protein N-acetyltransferase, RimJ/RimL family [Maridesulfovibrio ferrireducens]
MITLDKTNKNRINGKNLYLRPITPADVNEEYLRWMNDKEITTFLESRFSEQTLESIASFVTSMISDPANILFAICEKQGNRHVGNIRLGPINALHSFAEIGILIGQRDCWGKGYASEAIGLVVHYAFNQLQIHKLTSGAYACNSASIRTFEKNGFVIEGTLKDHFRHNGNFVNCIKLGLINPNYENE